MGRNALTLGITLVLGCSFDATGGGGGGTESGSDSGTESASETATDASTNASASDSDSNGTTSATSTSAGSTTTSGSAGSSSGASASVTDSDSGSTSGSTTDPGTTGPGSTSGSTTDPGTTGPGSTSGNTTDPGTTGGVVCEPPPAYSEIFWVADAMLSDGMQKGTSQSLPGNPEYAYSEDADVGVVTFEVEIPCEDDYWVWGLVWDAYAGTQNPSNADSFWYNADGGSDVLWAYGCGTFGNDDFNWSWEPLAELQANSQCPQGAYVQPLSAGTHHLNFRNRENGDFDNQTMAAIAAIVVSNDPNHDPYGDYQP